MKPRTKVPEAKLTFYGFSCFTLGPFKFENFKRSVNDFGILNVWYGMYLLTVQVFEKHMYMTITLCHNLLFQNLLYPGFQTRCDLLTTF